MIRQLFLIGLGSAVGGIARFLISQLTYSLYPRIFPFPTLLVNFTGCFLIGLFYALSAKTGVLSADMRLLLTTGLCGGFTTFSAFAYENIVLMKNGSYPMVLIYITASVVLGIFATFLGMQLFK
jgi:CrcB protein